MAAKNKKSTRGAWRDDRDLVRLADSRRNPHGVAKLVDVLPASELPILQQHMTRLGPKVVDWVANYVAKQDDLPRAQRLALGLFLLDHGPARVGDMKALAPYAKSLVSWASGRRIQQLTGVQLLQPEVLPRFLSHARKGLPIASYNRCRGMLVRLAEDAYPLGDYSDVPAGAARSPVSALDEDTFAAQCDQAGALNDSELRRTVQAILLLPRSCGVSETALKTMVGEDVYLDEDKNLRVRRAGPGEPYAVLSRFTRVLWYLKTQAGHGPLLAVGVEGDNITGNLGRRMERHGWDPGILKPKVAALVSAYRTEMGLRAVPALRLKSLMGGATLRSCDKLLEQVPADFADPHADIFGKAQIPLDLYTPEI